MLTGNDLITLGLRPGKHFPEILAHANVHGLAGEALAAYVIADVFHEGTAAAESLGVGRCQTTNCDAAQPFFMTSRAIRLPSSDR